MLLERTGLRISEFEPVLASMLGSEKGEEGCRVLAEAMLLGRSQVQLRDWLYCLAKAPGSIVRRRLIDAAGRTPDRFVSAIEDAMDDDDATQGVPPEKLTADVVSSDTKRFIEALESLARDLNKPRIGEELISHVLLQNLDSSIADLLVAWAGKEAFDRFLVWLKNQVTGAETAVEIFSTRLSPSDMTSPSDFLTRTNEGADAVAKFLAGKTSVKASPGASKQTLAGPLCENLNRLLEDPGLFDAAASDRSWGGDAAKTLTAKKPDATSLPIINRLILNLWSQGAIAPCKLNLSAFDGNGKKFCHRLREDSASLGAKQITTRHLLYTLLGNEASLLSVALAVRGVSVKTELHAALSRELARPGKKRNNDFEVTRDTVLPAVEQILRESHKLARDRGAKAMSEFDVSRAFVFKQPQELARLFPANPQILCRVRRSRSG